MPVHTAAEKRKNAAAKVAAAKRAKKAVAQKAADKKRTQIAASGFKRKPVKSSISRTKKKSA